MAARLIDGIRSRDGDAYLHDPVGWITDVLGDFVWSRQAEIAQAVHDHRRVAVHSSHQIGKSFIAARIVAWWLSVHAPGDAFVVTSATTGYQVRAILWREINRAHRAGNLTGRTNQTEWFIGDELVAFGRKPSDTEPTAFLGIHARYVLVILDEACGIPEDLYFAANSLAGNDNSRILAIGNPDDEQTHFGAICKPLSGWHVIHVSGLDSPNFTGESVPDTLRELLIGPSYVAEMANDVGEDSAIYRSKVLGLFTTDQATGVIPLSALLACRGDLDEPHSADSLLPVEIGFDVGAGGDEAVLRERRGVAAGRVQRYRTQDSEELVAHALDFINATGASRIKIDSIGIGWGIVGRLEGLRKDGYHRAEVIGVNVATKPSDPTRWRTLRDEMWWTCGREMTMAGAFDLNALDDKTLNQLAAPRQKPDAAGRTLVESKPDTKARIGRSTDDADAWLLAVYQPQTNKAKPGVWGLGRDD